MQERTCDGPVCSRKAGTSGLCPSHYKQRHLGKTLTPLRVATKDMGRPSFCEFPGCGRPHKARGLCKQHNVQALRSQPLQPIQDYGLGLICSAEDCGRESIARGLCARHRQVRYDLAIRYNMTVERFQQMLAAQGGVCAVCAGTNANGYRLSIDHDHACCPGQTSCGKCVRGLLCSKCNLILGHAEDDAARLRAAADYLHTAATKGVRMS